MFDGMRITDIKQELVYFKDPTQILSVSNPFNPCAI